MNDADQSFWKWDCIVHLKKNHFKNICFFRPDDDDNDDDDDDDGDGNS